MIVTKIIKMTDSEYDAVKQASYAFEKLENELENLKDSTPEDDGLASLWDNANSAYSAIWDFIQEYHRYMRWSS